MKSEATSAATPIVELMPAKPALPMSKTCSAKSGEKTWMNDIPNMK